MNRNNFFSILVTFLYLVTNISEGKAKAPILKKPIESDSLSPAISVVSESLETPELETTKTLKYQKLLKKNWLIPMAPAEYQRLSRRFTGLSLFDTEGRPWVIPGITLVTPTGYSAKWGDVFTSFSVNNRSRFGHIADGFAAIGMGFADPTEWIGIELTLGFLNVKKIFNSGKGLSGKIGHTFSDGTSVAIGKLDFLQWPRNAADTGSSEYLVVSRAFQLDYDATKNFSLLIVSVGVGDGQFKSDERFMTETPGLGLFGSLSMRIIPPINLIANWNHNLHMGASIAPFRQFPLIFTIGALDLLKTQGDGLRYVIGISYSDSFFSRSFPVNWFRGGHI